MSAKVRETKSKMTDSKPEDEGSRITDPEVLHSNNLRDDIWRQRKSSFLVSAILYVILGGATALIFVGLEAQNILDPLVVGKLISAGALWSSFYSFIDVKKVDDVNETIREKFDAEAVNKVDDVKKSFEAELKRQAADANRIIEDLGAKYNDLATKYNKLRGIK